MQAALSVDARGPGSSSVLRKAVVARMCDPALSLSVARFRELLAGGAAGFLLLLPAELARVSHQVSVALGAALHYSVPCPCSAGRRSLHWRRSCWRVSWRSPCTSSRRPRT